MESARKLTIGLAVLAALISAGAAYATQSWMPLLMVAPIALIVVTNWPPKQG